MELMEFVVIIYWDQPINWHAHHLSEREGIVSHRLPVTAAKIPEYGVSHHQPQSG